VYMKVNQSVLLCSRIDWHASGGLEDLGLVLA
jgi:hypothetical protein